MLRVLTIMCAGVECISPRTEIPKNQIVYLNQPVDGESIHFENRESTTEKKEDDNEKKTQTNE